MTNVNETVTVETSAVTPTAMADTSAPAKTNFDPLGFIEALHLRQVDWNTAHYKSTTQKLHALLADCLEANNQLGGATKSVRQAFFAKLADAKFTFKAGTSLIRKIVAYVFRIDGNRAAAYTRVLLIAKQENIGPEKLAGWLTANKGIEEVRRNYGEGNSPAVKKKTARDTAMAELEKAKCIAEVASLPVDTHGSHSGVHDFCLLLVRKNKATGKNEIVHASIHDPLINHYIDAVSKNVIAAAENNMQAAGTDKLAEREALLEAAIADVANVASSDALAA